jgi:[citrate (pro-3S)-lyase] ligase
MITEIKLNDLYSQNMMDALLAQEGIRRDKNLDYSCGIFDDDYDLMATGSCFKNTIRCTAVSSDHQGEGLLNQIMSHLMTVQAERGNSHVFVYTKPGSAAFFSDIGFYEIARTESVVFMENRRGGLGNWIAGLECWRKSRGNESDGWIAGQKEETENNNSEMHSEIENIKKNDIANNTFLNKDAVAAIVMNANPFTKGHRYLVEKAALESGLVHIFVLSEEAGPIPFRVRFELVRAGVSDLENVICHGSGDYIISSATFPGYFLEDEDEAVRAQAELDVAVFSLISKELGITARYAGDEPYSHTTAIYNEVMKEHLPEAGVEFIEVPRLEARNQFEPASGGESRGQEMTRRDARDKAISASIVRQAIHDEELESVADMLPPATLEFFRSADAEPVIRALKDEDRVAHDW